ncbi:predicted carboxypeptidase [Bacillus sp. OxB-1]|nr:predicted carboxypeptidase [Bacillus sp. OxB-1]
MILDAEHDSLFMDPRPDGRHAQLLADEMAKGVIRCERFQGGSAASRHRLVDEPPFRYV